MTEIDIARIRADMKQNQYAEPEDTEALIVALDRQSKISESLALKLMKSQSQLSEIRAALTEQDDQWRNGLVRKIRAILGPE